MDEEQRQMLLEIMTGSVTRPWSLQAHTAAQRFLRDGLVKIQDAHALSSGDPRLTHPFVLTPKGIEAIKDKLCLCSIPSADQVNVIPGSVFVGWGIGWTTCGECGGSGLKKDPEPAVGQMFRAIASRLHSAALANDWAEIARIRVTCEEAGYHFEQLEKERP